MDIMDNTTSHGNEREEYISNDPDIPTLNSIREKIDGMPPLSNDCCIYRVPRRLRDINEKAFTPQMVSIGPFHRGEEHLQAMEHDKLRYLQSFLNRTGMNLKNYIRKIKGWEERARSYYAESIQLSSDEFVEMILLDSCFVVEVIYRFNLCLREQTDYLDRQIFTDNLPQDLILIENQLPFFVLEDLFEESITPIQRSPSFLEHCINYFNFFYLISHIQQSFRSSPGVKHFVDLLRLCLLPSSLRSLHIGHVKYVPVRNATVLHEAGIKFKKSSSNRMLDITHNSREVLEIPQLCITRGTESLLLNVVVLEQYHYWFDSYIIDFIHFMDNLIDTAKDVDLLIQNEIFENSLGDSSAVADLFNKLPLEVILCNPNYYFSDISENLNKYWKERWPRWKAILRRDYFSTPWSVASTIAAMILLGLTLIQTICSIASL